MKNQIVFEGRRLRRRTGRQTGPGQGGGRRPELARAGLTHRSDRRCRPPPGAAAAAAAGAVSEAVTEVGETILPPTSVPVPHSSLKGLEAVQMHSNKCHQEGIQV